MNRVLTAAAISLAAMLALPAAVAAEPTGWGGGNTMGLPGPAPGGLPYNGGATATYGQYGAPSAPSYTIGVAVYPAYQPQSPLGRLAEQSALGDMSAAESALDHGGPIAALTNTENAETVLLNGQQAGVLPYPETHTLAALSAADRDLQTPWGSAAAASALHTALADLR